MTFEAYEEREKQLSLFNDWAEFEGLDLRMSGEFEHSDKGTHLAFLGYKAGQQSKQEEIDKLKLIISEAIAVYDRPMCDETALYQRDDDIYHILTENKYV